MQIALKEDLDSLKEKLHTSKTHISFCIHSNLHQVTLGAFNCTWLDLAEGFIWMLKYVCFCDSSGIQSESVIA